MKYVLQGTYKIGLSKDVMKRRNQLILDEQGILVEIEIIHLIQTDDMKRLEKETARFFNVSSRYLGREMWELTQEDIYEFCTTASCFFEDAGVRPLDLFR